MNTLDYTCFMRGEDGMEFSTQVEAASRDEARDKVQEWYPESTVLEVNSPADLRAREQDLYEHAQRVYDDPQFDDYDY